MSRNPASNRRRTTSLPVTTMEEVPVLSADEQAKLRAELEAAQARVAAGEGIEQQPAELRRRLIQIYRASKRQ
jgi:hypothetical protein